MCLKGVLEAIAKDGIDPESIEMIISTHSHPDHFDGVKYFIEKKAKMALHQDEDTFLKETGKGFYNMFGLTMPDYRVDTYLKEGTLEVNNTDIEIYHTPGHSGGCNLSGWSGKDRLSRRGWFSFKKEHRQAFTIRYRIPSSRSWRDCRRKRQG